MKLSLYVTVVCGALLWAITGCKPMPNDGVPFYLDVDSVYLKTESAQGLNTHRIRDRWVEAGADNLGAYELPADFPVLQENETSFVISAGIEENGQSGKRVIYPFYTIDTLTLNAERSKRYLHVPKFAYTPGTKFSLVADFEGSNQFNNMQSASDSNVVYGSTCGSISVTSTDSNVIATSIDAYDLPEGQEIWLEFDYKSQVPFYVGIYAIDGGSALIRSDIVFVNSRTGWSHLYVKFSETVGYLATDAYRIYFEALRPVGVTQGTLFIDNVKLVHF